MAHGLHFLSLGAIVPRIQGVEMRGPAKVCLLWAVAVVLVPVQARADGYVAPWLGFSIASATDDGRRGFGVTAGYMGAGVFGFEGDFGYSPDFFGSRAEFGNSNANTAMGNFILGVPICGTHCAGARPLVSGVLGLMASRIEGGRLVDVSRTNNRFVYNIGAGMMGFFNQHVGLRGDVRYLRSLRDTNLFSGVDFDPGRLSYWRVSGGVTFR